MKDKSTLLKGVLMGMCVSGLIVGTYFGWPYLKRFFGSPEITIKYQYADNLYLMEHDFVYAVTLDIDGQKNTLMLKKNADNQFDIWKPGESGNRIYATAFMIDSSGTCITSEYAVSPWLNKTDYKLLSSLLMKEFSIQEYQITIKGYSLKIMLRKYGDSDTTTSISYKPFGYTGEDANEQVRYLQKMEKTQITTCNEVSFPEAINANTEKLYLFGAADQQSYTTIPTQALVTILEKFVVTNTKYFNFQQTGKWLPEGAPVFNKKGEFVGVYSDFDYTMAINPNILSSPIRKTTDLNQFVTQNSQITADESYFFLGQSEEKPTAVPVEKKWITVGELKDNSNFDTNGTTPYSTNFWNLGSTNESTNESWWHAPDIKINKKNTRILVTIDKLVKSETYLSVLRITIFDKGKDGSLRKNLITLEYDQEETYTESLWKLDGSYEIMVEGMDGCKFKVELQTEVL